MAPLKFYIFYTKRKFSFLSALPFFILFEILIPGIGFSQSSRVLVQNAKGTNPTTPIINVKWYNQQFVYKKGVNVYRKENGGTWVKLNTVPIVIQGTVPPALLQRDEDLQMFVDMAKEIGAAEEDGFVLLTLFGKSFQSPDYSRLIGIQYDDAAADWGKSYQYRITKLEGSKEVELAISPALQVGVYVQEDSILDLNITLKKNIARMKWREEEKRYYGVNIYRSTKTNLTWMRVNRNPIVQSESESGPEADIMFEDDSLKEGTIYYYRVAGLDFFGEETVLTAPREIRVGDLTPPLPPMNPKKRVKILDVSISWEVQPVEDLAGFHLYRSAKSDGPFERVTTILTASTDTVFTDCVPQPGFYYYYVASVDRAGNESTSFTILAEVQDVIPPLPPTHVQANADTGKIVLTWRGNSEPDIMGYYLYRAISETTTSQFVLINAEPLKDSTYTQVFAKNASNKFLFKVIAVDTSFNQSQPSQIVSARMPDVTAPIVPVIRNIIIRGDTVVIQWLTNPEPDLKEFKLFRSEKDDHIKMQLIAKNIAPKAKQFSDTIRQAGKYYYQLQAIDESGNTSLLSEAFPVLKAEVFRFAFGDIKGKYKKLRRSVILAWSVKGTPSGYSVFRKKMGDDAAWKPVSGLIKELEFVDKSISKKAQYQYHVRAYSQAGEVVISSSVEFKTK